VRHRDGSTIGAEGDTRRSSRTSTISLNSSLPGSGARERASRRSARSSATVAESGGSRIGILRRNAARFGTPLPHGVNREGGYAKISAVVSSTSGKACGVSGAGPATRLTSR
jgi:hypothetical protein